MIVCISDDNILIVAQAESMGRVELAFSPAELSEFESDVHRSRLIRSDERRRRRDQRGLLRRRQQRATRWHAAGTYAADAAKTVHL